MFNRAEVADEFDGDSGSDATRPSEKPVRRNRPGISAQVGSTTRLVARESPNLILFCHWQTKTGKEWNKWADENLDEMESTLAVQQYIQQIIRKDQSDVDTILAAPDHQDEGVWKYEHLRQFCLELNQITVRLQDECSPQVCTQMTATEQWIFLCAAHKNPKEVRFEQTKHTSIAYIESELFLHLNSDSDSDSQNQGQKGQKIWITWNMEPS